MPIYESAQDRQRERRVAATIEQATGWSLFGSETTGAFDYFAVDSNRVWQAIIEVKCRTNRHDAYPTYMIDQSKVEKVRQLSEPWGIRGLVVVAFTNGTAYFDVADVTDIKPSRGGRTDRGDQNDIDDVLQIPIDRLRNIKGIKPS
jgi:Holliday junction resolvase-like predicted endonuclease